MYKNKCLLCNNTENVFINSGVVECPFCGRYQIDFNVLVNNDKTLLTDSLRLKIRYVVKKYYLEKQQGLLPFTYILDKQKIKNIEDGVVLPTLLEKIDLVLGYISNKTTFISENVQIDPNTLFPLFFCANNYELKQIIDYLKEKKLIVISDLFEGRTNKVLYNGHEKPNDDDFKHNYYDFILTGGNGTNYTLRANEFPKMNIRLTADGIKYISEKQLNKGESKQCFVAMWFNKKEPNMQKVYSNYIKPAIEESDKKFKSIKINDVQHPNDINDQIITEIRKSRFMVVDLTGYRGGVYFEAGFGFGLGIPVIYTCHKDWLNSQYDEDNKLIHEGVHFDVNHRAILFWTDNKDDSEYEELNLDKFKKKLTAKINAIIL